MANFIQTLNNMDISDLSFDNVGRWPKGLKIALFVVAFAVVTALTYWIFIADKQIALKNAINQEADFEHMFKIQAKIAANLDDYQDQMTELEKRLQVLVKQLPSETEVPGLLEDITATFLKSGLTSKSILLQSELAHDYYIELPISIEATGGFHDFASFVSGVSGLPRIVTLNDFSVQQAGIGLLHFTIVAKTYRYKESDDEK